MARPQATHVLESLSLRASVAMRGNPVNKKVRHSAHIYYLCSNKKTGRGPVFYLMISWTVTLNTTSWPANSG